MKKVKDYKKTYNEFWKDIVEKDGKLNKDQIMRELSDFSFMLDQVPKVYCEVSGGMISKTNTYAYEVIEEFNERFLDKAITQDDLRDMVEDCKTKKELVDEIKDYFELNN